jgi:hypothetical protein
MNGIPVIFALGYAPMLAGLACWCLEMLRLRARLGALERRVLAAREEQEASLETLRRTVEGLAAQWREPRVAEMAMPLRPGLNLSKRSQALRLHRRGDDPQQIAERLELPVQEVELLLKVHEIVMRAL